MILFSNKVKYFVGFTFGKTKERKRGLKLKLLTKKIQKCKVKDNIISAH
jgi:hypothetical protein